MFLNKILLAVTFNLVSCATPSHISFSLCLSTHCHILRTFTALSTSLPYMLQQHGRQPRFAGPGRTEKAACVMDRLLPSVLSFSACSRRCEKECWRRRDER